MWVRALDGRLLNLDHATDICLSNPDSPGAFNPKKWSVVARLDKQHRVALAEAETQERAQAILDRVWQAIKTPEGFMEL